MAVLSALCLAACALFPNEADAATASVQWLPGDDVTVTRYDVYVRSAGVPYATSPAWSGKPVPDADGVLEAIVPFTPASSGANYFAVSAVSGSDQSALSRELWTGTPIACRADSCASTTSCDFSGLPDGTSCDASTGDPCAAVCLGGTCTASSGESGGADVEIDRLRFTTRAADIKLAFKGKFASDAAIDPAGTGATIELRAADGTMLYSSSIAASSFRTLAGGKRFHFGASRGDADPPANGIRRLDLRHSGSRWIVSAQATSSDLTAASLEPALTVVVRVGETCARRIAAECEQKATVSMCR